MIAQYIRKEAIKMKKFISLMLCILMLAGLCSAALAETPAATFTSTRTVLSYLDRNDITYEIYGLDDDGDELIIIPNSDSEIGVEYDIYLFFDSNNENCYIYVWRLMEFTDANYLRVLQTVNAINDDYRYVTFTVDEDTNSVFVTLDLIYRDHDVDAIVWEGLFHIVNVIHDAYANLAPYAV